MDLQTAVTQHFVGAALIVSNSYGTTLSSLPGTRQDAVRMTRFLKDCQYKVYRRHNITKNQFVTLYEQLANHEYPTTCRRLVVYFAGHGNNGTLILQDGQSISINDMMAKFKPAGANNPTLGNMAQIFIIDACRGNQTDPGYPNRSGPPMRINLNAAYPNDANMIVAYSTMPEHVNTENATGGTWTSCLLERLRNSDEDLLGILIQVNRRMMTTRTNGTFQIGQTVHSLTERIYFRRSQSGRLNRKKRCFS